MQAENMENDEKNFSKVKGGLARAQKLSNERKSEIAKTAALARWGKDLPEATHIGVIDSLGLACYVLNDETRVLSRISFLQALGWKGKAKGGRQYDDEFQTPVFLTADVLKPFISRDLTENAKPVLFMYKGQRMIGYKAELLPQVCEMYLQYRDDCQKYERPIRRQYKDIVPQADSLMRALASVGIIALVDEATGYQYTRARSALEEILIQFVQKDLRKWIKTFPDEFYFHICRLKGWQYDEQNKNKRGISWARLTNQMIYDRLAPGVKHELKRQTPRNEKGRYKSKLFQRLTADIGHPRLRELLASEIALMRIFDDGEWDVFEEKLNKAIPVYRELPLFDSLSKEDQAKLL